MQAKSIFIIVLLSLHGMVAESQRVIKEAIVKSTIYTSVANSEEKVEVDLTTWLKSPKLKVFQKSAYADNSVYIDRTNEKIVTLYETMGKKIGFFIYDSLNPAKQRIWDSVEVTYIDSSRNINNFNCKEAILKYPRSTRQKDVEIWYDPDFVFDDRNMGLNIYGANKIHGAVLSFKTPAANNLIVEYKITSIDTATAIESKLFEIPTGFEIKTPREFQIYMNKLRTTN